VKLVDAFYAGDTKLAGEIRQRVAKWGATVEDRARLRMSIEDEGQEHDKAAPETAEVPETADMDEELFRLLNGA
jgi:hypothetical protein